ncbi:MAG: protoporphyrinogen/coproporphyrinogen oxidase, partial [Planctomycetota bacterium]
LIVGAGPTGLAAAQRLEQKGCRDWLIVERAGGPGGLSASFRDAAGFTWDLGGHVIHSHYPEFAALVSATMGGDLLEHERRAFIRAAGSWVPYPFQNNLHHLPEAVREECLEGMFAAREAEAAAAAPPATFGEWVDRSFGRGVAEHFMRPYNRKIWCRELGEMSAGWVADRVSLPDLDRLADDVRAGRDDASFGANSTFTFPKSGGTGELWRRAAESLPAGRIRYSTAAEAPDVEARECRLAGGGAVAYESLVWTAPLTELSAGGPAAGLERTCVEVLGLGLAGSPPEPVADMCWVYFPDPGVPFYRATVFSNYSPENVPRPGETWSLMLEVARRPGWPCRVEDLWPRTLKAVAAAGLAPAEVGVLSRWHRSLPHAYPVPTPRRDEALAGIVPALEERGVYPRGRFGAWRYEVGNMDHCWMQGVEVADRILEGTPETVLKPLHERV